MSRCDWCESQVGIKKVFCAEQNMGEVNLCIVCQTCFRDKPAGLAQAFPVGASSTSSVPYNMGGDSVSLVNWLIPRILD